MDKLTDKQLLESRIEDAREDLKLARANSFSLAWIPIAIEIMQYIIDNLIDRNGKRWKMWQKIRKYAHFGFFVAGKLITFRK